MYHASIIIYDENCEEHNENIYCKLAALSKFRCGVAPIKIETGRYEGLNIDDRKCPFCNVIESESHVILNCTLYDDIRAYLFDSALVLHPQFNAMSDDERFSFLFTKAPVTNVVRQRYNRSTTEIFENHRTVVRLSYEFSVLCDRKCCRRPLSWRFDHVQNFKMSLATAVLTWVCFVLFYDCCVIDVRPCYDIKASSDKMTLARVLRMSHVCCKCI